MTFFFSERVYPTVQFSLLESLRCHSTDEYLVYGVEEEVGQHQVITPDKRGIEDNSKRIIFAHALGMA